jgi:hypothetical protein
VRGKSCSTRARREYQSIETQVVVLPKKEKENGGTSRPPPLPHIKGQATRVQSPDSWETDVRSTSFSNDNNPEEKKKKKKDEEQKRLW